MSRSSMVGKLRPAKKALKRFTRSIQSKFQNISLSKSIKFIKSNTNRFLAYCSRHFIFLPFKKRSITKPPYRSQQFNHLYQSYCNKNVRPIFIDQLYGLAEGSSSSSVDPDHLRTRAGTSTCNNKGKEVVQEKVILPQKESGSKAKEKILYSVEDAWREVVARSPQLRPVDERADEFIYKFREEIILQKEKSALEFQEMLKRSA